MPVPRAISQLFAILLSRILEVIYKPRDRALSVHKLKVLNSLNDLEIFDFRKLSDDIIYFRHK